jgi:hypothetical protein
MPFLRGESPEAIVDSFPVLTLEQVFGALSFYLANRETVDHCLRAGRDEFDLLRGQARQADPALYARLVAGRKQPERPSA